MAFKQGAPSKCLDALKFTCYSADEIRKLSVKHITNPTSLDSLLNPTENGLYDPVLGPPTRLDSCATCGLGSATCPGHMGHIELPLPVYHPAFFKILFYLLRGSCLKCCRILIHQPKLLLLLYKLRAINRGLFQLVNKLQDTYSEVVSEQSVEVKNSGGVEILDAELKRTFHAWLDRDIEKPGGVLRDINEQNVFSKNATELKKSLVKEFVKLMTLKLSKCQYCAADRPALRSEQNSKIFLVENKDKTRETTQHYLTPILIREHISKLWENDQAILENVFGAFHDTAFGDKVPDASPDGKSDLSNARSAAIDVLFVSVLPVPPSRYRPVMVVNGRQYENPQTSIYSKIILDSILLRTLMTNLNEDDVMEEKSLSDVNAIGKTTMWKKASNDIQISDRSMDMLAAISGKTKGEKLENCWDRLQQHVNVIYDSDLSRTMTASADKCPGIKQKLEKKGGLFRKHMMGKRVNYAARSVISPDPYIATHEIGVPLCFASKLTYPTPVTPWNVKKLRKAVINGPDIYPGATMVVQEDGNVTLLKADNENQRMALAKNLNAPQKDRKKRKQGLKGIKTVLRHMQNGDVMLLNRQPTLHKGSIMAHKVRVLPGEKTLRLHYANCKSYNADFDGDEMNAHFPQSELCRAEAFELMSTNTQYLSMKDGKPLSGLIQDHMVAGVSISIRGRCFTREQYQQLSYNALMHIPKRIKLLRPAFLKPKVLWTGKQIFSTILINITPAGFPLLNLCGSSKIQNTDWSKHKSRATNIGAKEMCESEVIIRGSELLCGVLDKNHYGPAEYGLVHSMYELYGCITSGQLLTCLARLFTAFLQQYRGLTLGVYDILVTERADDGRKEVIRRTLESGIMDIAATVGLNDVTNTDEIKSRMQDAHLSKITGGEDGLVAIDHAVKKASNDITDQIGKLCTGSGLMKTFPNNNLQLIVISGAKGGAVNCMQISCLLGQIELEGRRPPLMPSGRSVPSFLPYDLTLRAGGFISQRFLTGIRPQEYFYHCMAGREGLVDTAVKTSRSGYLQRCLIKHLEGLVLAYDLTVRDSDGSILQFLYGEDGIDIGREPFLNPKQYKFLSENFESECNLLPTMEQVESTVIDTTKADKLWRKMNRRLKRKRKAEKRMMRERDMEKLHRRKSPFLEFTWENKQLTKSQAIQAWRTIVSEKKNEYIERMDVFKMPDPISASLRPDIYLGSMSEKFKEKLDDYMKSNPDNLPLQVKKKKAKIPSLERVKSMLNLKYQRALCPPGESVGLLAAQSIGEPSTQMTLNTFHFAGRGEMNVTLGIPRLREILMVAAKQISTPQVIVPVRPGKKKQAQKLQKQLTCVKLSQVLHKVSIQENLDVDSGTLGHRSRRCKIKIEILPEKQFKKDLALSRKQVLNYIEKHFLRSLLSAVNQQLRKRQEEEMVFSQKMARATQDQDENIDERLEEAEPNNDTADDKGEEEDEGFEEEDAKHGKNKEDYEDDEPEEYADDVEETVMQNDDNDDTEENSTVATKDLQVNKFEVASVEKRARISKITTLSVGSVSVLEYDFDEVENKWCKMVIDMPLKSAQVNVVSLLEQEANVSFVRSVKGITRCMLQNSQNGQLNLATEGINFYTLFEHADTLDLNRLKCNCVHSMETTYGIEAAVRVIEREITNVFAVYGIEVSRRHLSIVADYMCFLGKYNAFNRIGIENCASPLQQMTFETTVKFLNDATLSGQWDSLQSPSARIVAGQVVKGGTGNFTLKIPLSEKAYKKQCGLSSF